MSWAAEWIRKRLLRGKLEDANRESRELWRLIQVAYGFGGQPPQEAIERFQHAVAEGERLMLELHVSL